MTRILRTAVAAMALLALVFISAKIKDKGEFTWNKTTHDFDRILRGQTYTYRFTFTNSGDEPITVKNVTTNSPYATAKWTTTAVRPLQTGFVDVSLTPTRAGSELVSITVQSNANPAETTLWIKGEVMTAQEMK